MNRSGVCRQHRQPVHRVSGKRDYRTGLERGLHPSKAWAVNPRRHLQSVNAIRHDSKPCQKNAISTSQIRENCHVAGAC